VILIGTIVFLSASAMSRQALQRASRPSKGLKRRSLSGEEQWQTKSAATVMTS
jgi:hypothetical protein